MDAVKNSERNRYLARDGKGVPQQLGLEILLPRTHGVGHSPRCPRYHEFDDHKQKRDLT